MKVTITFPHYETWRWTSIAVEALKRFPFPTEHEIIVVNNSPHSQSIKCLTETSLGEGVRIIDGDPEITSHGQALSLAYEASDSDWIFTCESDSFPVRDSWGHEYVKASEDFDYIGPHMALAGGVFIHPCGALASRKVVEACKEWRKKYSDWVHVPGAAVTLGLSDKAYHVTCEEAWLKTKLITAELQKQVDIWKKAGPWQYEDSFDDDSFDDYWLRKEIRNWEPHHGIKHHLRIGYEPGELLSFFAQKNFNCMHAPTVVEWIPGWENRQAAKSTIFGGFSHIWCGTSSFSPAIDPVVREFKMKQMAEYWLTVPQGLREQIEKLEAQHA